MFRDFRDFSVWEKASTDTIDFKKIYVDVAEDLVAGLLLSQIVYWYLPGKDGKTKLRVKHGGHLWIVKKRTEWYDEIRLSEANYKTAVKKLEAKKLVVKERHRFDGAPTTFLRLDIKVFLTLMNEKLSTLSTGTGSNEEEEFYDYLNEQLNSGDEPYSPNDSVESTESETVESTETESVKSTESETVESAESETVESTKTLTKSTNIDYVTENTNKEYLSEKKDFEEEDYNTRMREFRSIKIRSIVDKLNRVTEFSFALCLDIATILFDEKEKKSVNYMAVKSAWNKFLKNKDNVGSIAPWFATTYVNEEIKTSIEEPEEPVTEFMGSVPFYNWLEQ
jgi:hypothetical protein